MTTPTPEALATIDNLILGHVHGPGCYLDGELNGHLCRGSISADVRHMVTRALTAQAREIERLTAEIDLLRSEAGYHDAQAVIEQVTAQRDTIQRATWEAAAKLAEEESLVPEDEKYDNEEAIQKGQGTYYNLAMARIARVCRARAAAQGGRDEVRLC